MMNVEDIKNLIWDLMNCLRGLIFSPDRLSGAVVRLIFLKYAVDNSIGATDVESMQFLAKAQKMFAMRDIEYGLDTIIPVLHNIDRVYKLDQIISSDDMVEKYAGELFGMDRSRQKKNVSDLSFKRVIDRLGSMDLEEEPESHELGRVIVDVLFPIMSSSMEQMGKVAAENMSNLSLSRLAKAILNVEKHDVFCDFVAGIGISTIAITGNTLPDVIHIDVNKEAAAMSAMLLIMYGYSHFKVICENSLMNRLPYVSGSKVFADPPAGLRLEKTNENRFSDGSLAAIDRIIHGYLSQEGTAVVTTPSGPLFRQGPAIELKEEIVTLGLLHAVIALPPMWSGASIGTNLLVLSKKPSFNTLFVDASDRATTTDRKRARTSNFLSDETIQEIVEVIHNPHDILGFARVVPGSEISNKEYNLVPANYVIKQQEEETITLSEIDDQLNELYRQLMPQ